MENEIGTLSHLLVKLEVCFYAAGAIYYCLKLIHELVGGLVKLAEKIKSRKLKKVTVKRRKPKPLESKKSKVKQLTGKRKVKSSTK